MCTFNYDIRTIIIASPGQAGVIQIHNWFRIEVNNGDRTVDVLRILVAW